MHFVTIDYSSEIIFHNDILRFNKFYYKMYFIGQRLLANQDIWLTGTIQ